MVNKNRELKLMNKIQSVRGMNDILPSETSAWHLLEDTFASLVASYGYSEIRTPIVESTDLFKRSIGEATDIVEKEMYTFTDRNGDSLTLRPEGTVGVVRAIIENGLLQERLKLWYRGQMFRHERPQKGRFRQFHQLGCEVFNLQGAEIDAELIALSSRLWRLLGINAVELQINSLGSNEARAKYKLALVAYLENHALDQDSKRRLQRNPLRILDSKNPDMQEIISSAPKLSDYLDRDSQHHFELLCQCLSALDIPYTINPKLVRGLDYYNKTVFEWVSNDLGAQGTICAGGRYDGLVEQIGGKPTFGVGFALGVERLLSLINKDLLPESRPDIYLVLQGEQAQLKGLALAEKLRNNHPLLTILVNCDGGSFKAQFKRADKINAKFAFILSEDELVNNSVSIKNLQVRSEQQSVEISQLDQWISQQLSA